MASRAAGQVTLRGRFSPGDVVKLTRVAGEHVLRPEGGEEIEVQSVGEEKDAPRVGFVRFSKGVEVGARYFVHGLHEGTPLEVRVRGRAKDDPEEVLSQAPILPDRVRLADGSWADDAPTKESAPQILAGQADIRHAKKGTVLRSDTPRGEAHPVDVDRPEPVRPQSDVPEGTVQMSDTPAGEATELVLGPQRQEDVPAGVFQRSATPTGVATPLPAGDAIAQARDRESSAARESRGEPVRASAEPLEVKGAKVGAPTGATQKASEERHAELRRSENEVAPSTAAPIADVAPSVGEDRDADSPRQFKERAKSSKRSEASKKAAATRKRNERTAKAEKARAEKARLESKTSAGPGGGKPSTGAATTTNTTAKE